MSEWRIEIFAVISDRTVYFDNLFLQLKDGNLLEETHYYPHGLPIKALAKKDVGHRENRHRYQSNEYIEDNELRWMDFHARQYDPQLGRFMGIDSLAYSGGQQIYSPYSAMGNAPSEMIDPNGEISRHWEDPTAAANEALMNSPGRRAWLLGRNPNSWDALDAVFGMNNNQTMLMAGGSGGGNEVGSGSYKVVAYAEGDAARALFNRLLGGESINDLSQGEKQTSGSESAEGQYASTSTDASSYESGSVDASVNGDESNGEGGDGKAAQQAVSNDKNSNEYIQVYIWSGTETNKDYGHTAIRVDSKVYGYYPTTDFHYSEGKLKIETLDDFKTNRSGNVISVYTVEVSLTQKIILTGELNKIAKNPSHYSIYNRQCTSLAIRLLNHVNIPIIVTPTCQWQTTGTLVTPDELNSMLQSPLNSSRFSGPNIITVDSDFR